MADNSIEAIPKYLEQSLSPHTAKQAETLLKSIDSQPGFSINLLNVIASTNVESSIRLAGALFFKNLIKRKWVDEDGNYLLPIEDIRQIKLEIVDLMMKLPGQLQVQIGESISIIAESDFPHSWSNLIDEIVSKLSLDDFVSNKGLLVVAHSIFKKWRPLFRSDELFLEIKLVLDKFAEPFLTLLKRADELIQKNKDNKAALIIYLDNLLSLIQIYYDLNSQDIPEFFEDNLVTGMEIIHKYLIFESSLITDPHSDDDIDVLIKIKTSILELISLYVSRYADVFEPLIENFIITVWKLINDYVTSQQKFDQLVVKSLGFLSSVAKMPKYQPLFKSEDSLKQITENIIFPNIYFREADEELFEDEPINFVRSDLEGSDFDSRRKSATDFLRELKEVNSDSLTNIVMTYVNSLLSHTDWKNKNMAIYLFSALAAKGTVTNSGITSTNVLVDVVKFFSDNIANYLVAGQGTHPILRSDAIKYILSFRNQLTKDQLVSLIPILIDHLKDENVVVYTYAAITIEKMFSMRDFTTHQVIFSKNDVVPHIHGLLNNLFTLILSNSHSPEKLAENEFLVKCVMRILAAAEDFTDESFRVTLADHLLKILQIIAKNPSNPRFSHYIFESLGLLVKYGNKDGVDTPKIAELYLPALLEILNEDVQEFVPYVFQILAYILEVYPKAEGIPEGFKQLIRPLLAPAVWEFRGNIPSLTRLLIATLEQDPSVFINDPRGLAPLLGVFQKLIASKAHELSGFDLLQSILIKVPLENLKQYLNQIALLLMTRLKNSRTERFVKRFVVFINLLCVLPLSSTVITGLNADFAINFIDSVQAGVFPQIFDSFVLPTSGILVNLQDKKITSVGLSQLLISQIFTQGEYSNLSVRLLDQLCKNLATLSGISKSGTTLGGDNSMLLDDNDFESVSFGSSYSKIVAIDLKPFDPLPNIKNNDFGAIKLAALSNIRKINNMAILRELSIESQSFLKESGF